MTQPAILAPPPLHASFLRLDVRHDARVHDLRAQVERAHTEHLLVALGGSLITLCGGQMSGLEMPTLHAAGMALPHTPSALLVRVAGSDPGEVLHRERALLARLPAFQVSDRVQAFKHGSNRDLTGYEDGTENPTGADAVRAALQTDGSSVVAVQRWVHDFDAFDSLGRTTQDHAIGRDRDTNEELEDAPASAHVKRTAQEDFEPEAFVVRRSMPWSDHRGAGLVFVSFSATPAPFVAQMRRMCGEDDGIEDALFTFTRPVTGGLWWCPPVRDGALDLSRL